MNRTELSQRIAPMYDAEAESYEATAGHGILTAAEKEAWRTDLLSVVCHLYDPLAAFHN